MICNVICFFYDFFYLFNVCMCIKIIDCDEWGGYPLLTRVPMYVRDGEKTCL